MSQILTMFLLLILKWFWWLVVVILSAGIMLSRTKKDVDCTSTRKAFRSFSLSMVLIATSFPFHTALKTTPNVPLPTACRKTGVGGGGLESNCLRIISSVFTIETQPFNILWLLCTFKPGPGSGCSNAFRGFQQQMLSCSMDCSGLSVLNSLLFLGQRQRTEQFQQQASLPHGTSVCLLSQRCSIKERTHSCSYLLTLLVEHVPSKLALKLLLLNSRWSLSWTVTASTWMSSRWMSSNRQPAGVSTIAAERRPSSTRAYDAGDKSRGLCCG